jgi:PIN domain nuclease of toxin-antitoxin system
MEYLADTVAIVRYLRSHPALGSEAGAILRAADDGVHHVYISGITLLEVLYLAEAGRIDVPLPELVSVVASSSNYEIVPVDADVVLAAIDVDDVPDLHDRIIVATAVHLGVPILTGDRVIATSRHIETIW